jgi:hypothetical protein
MPNYDFKKDLPIARATELEVAGLLYKNYNAKLISSNHTNEYDLLISIDGKKTTIEVKEDFTCEKTGNIGLEYESWGRPAGIAVSKAAFYVYKAHTKNGIKYILHKTQTLKDKIAKQTYFRIVCGGDVGSNSMNYLFKYNEFIKDAWFLKA